MSDGASEQHQDSSLIRPPSRARVVLWLVTATLTGSIIMAMELSAFRLYAPYFGYSIYVWGSMISVVMVALAGGYGLGGWLADRSRSDVAIYLIILGSGVYQLAIVFLARPVLRWLWQSGDFYGPVCATLIIFAVPMTALAMTSPFVIRLLARSGRVGVTVGNVFALSTVGSIAGILATSFYLVPRFGTRATLQLLCALSIVVGTAGLAANRRTGVVSILFLAPLFFVPKQTFSPAVVWTTESAYNWVAVMRKGDLQWLVLNDPRGFESVSRAGQDFSGYYFDEFALGPLLVPARNVLVLGMGAGASIAATRAVAPDLQIDAVEIDPEVVETAVRFFGLPRNDAKLRVFVDDARPWLARYRGYYDIVHVDLYQGGPYVPFYLATVEFFGLIRAHLSDGGVLIMNVYDLSPDHELLGAAGATLRRVFATVIVKSRTDGNHIVFAFPQKRSIADLRSRLQSANGPAWVKELASTASSAIAEFESSPGALVFTDDRAPVEEMTRRMLFWRR